jgi:hypothetical protein
MCHGPSISLNGSKIFLEAWSNQARFQLKSAENSQGTVVGWKLRLKIIAGEDDGRGGHVREPLALRLIRMESVMANLKSSKER